MAKFLLANIFSNKTYVEKKEIIKNGQNQIILSIKTQAIPKEFNRCEEIEKKLDKPDSWIPRRDKCCQRRL